MESKASFASPYHLPLRLSLFIHRTRGLDQGCKFPSRQNRLSQASCWVHLICVVQAQDGESFQSLLPFNTLFPEQNRQSIWERTDSAFQ